jgi:hypothetical protein
MKNLKHRRTDRCCSLQLEPLEARIALDDTSASIRGINARFLTTTGSLGLAILTGGDDSALGQVELGRPNKPWYESRTKGKSRTKGTFTIVGAI